MGSIIFIVGGSGRSLKPGLGLQGGLAWGLVVRPRIPSDKLPVIAVSSSPGAWEGRRGSAVQMITVPSTEPVASLGCNEL